MRIALFGLLMLLAVSIAQAQYLGNVIVEGEVKQIMMADKVYELTLLSVADDRELAVFKVNGEVSKALGEREKHVFSDGSTVFVASVLPNEGAEAGGADLVEFYFLATGGVLAKPVSRDEPAEAYEPIIDFLEQWGVASDSDISGPVGSAECIVDSDCADNDGCSGDGCAGGRCVHIPQNGCSFDPGVCVAYNTRMNVEGVQRYCAADRSWSDQVALGASCLNNHECISNLCYGGVCKEVDENGHVVAAGPSLESPRPVIVSPPAHEGAGPIVVIESPPPSQEAPSPSSTPHKSFWAWLLSRLFWWA